MGQDRPIHGVNIMSVSTPEATKSRHRTIVVRPLLSDLKLPRMAVIGN